MGPGFPALPSTHEKPGMPAPPSVTVMEAGEENMDSAGKAVGEIMLQPYYSSQETK